MQDNTRRYVLEMIGTFILVFMGAGSIVANAYTEGALGPVGVALANGLALAAAFYAISGATGAHVNPAVTIGMWVTKRISTANAAGYIVGQLAGAAIAGWLLTQFYSNALAVGAGVPVLSTGISFAKGVAIEAVLTFLLVFALFATAVDRRGSPNHAALAIGFVLAASVLVGGGLTGAALNPARAFGPAIAVGFWENHAVYWVGPILGAIAAALFYSHYVLGVEAKPAMKAKKKR